MSFQNVVRIRIGGCLHRAFAKSGRRLSRTHGLAAYDRRLKHGQRDMSALAPGRYNRRGANTASQSLVRSQTTP